VPENSGIYSRPPKTARAGGIEIEIAREIAADFGTALQTVPVKKSDLLGALGAARAIWPSAG
jgi:hypothetical protein